MKKNFLLLLTIVFLSVLMALPAWAQLFVVNSTGDAGDINLTDGICVTGGFNALGDPECTLRAALEESRATPGAFTIRFNIPANDPSCTPVTGVCTIQPNTPFEQIAQQVEIRGYSQSGATRATSTTPATLKIVLDGSQTTGNGLEITSVGLCKVEGLAIINFSADGIHIQQGANGNTIRGNHIGTDESGITAHGNFRGVAVLSNDNQIGGKKSKHRNIISGNDDTGVYINVGSANKVLGNFIGTTSDGSAVLGNTGVGVLIDDATDNKIGGKASGARNIISGNTGGGIEIQNGSARSRRRPR